MKQKLKDLFALLGIEVTPFGYYRCYLLSGLRQYDELYYVIQALLQIKSDLPERRLQALYGICDELGIEY